MLSGCLLLASSSTCATELEHNSHDAHKSRLRLHTAANEEHRHNKRIAAHEQGCCYTLSVAMSMHECMSETHV